MYPPLAFCCIVHKGDEKWLQQSQDGIHGQGGLGCLLHRHPAFVLGIAVPHLEKGQHTRVLRDTAIKAAVKDHQILSHTFEIFGSEHHIVVESFTLSFISERESRNAIIVLKGMEERERMPVFETIEQLLLKGNLVFLQVHLRA